MSKKPEQIEAFAAELKSMLGASKKKLEERQKMKSDLDLVDTNKRLINTTQGLVAIVDQLHEVDLQVTEILGLASLSIENLEILRPESSTKPEDTAKDEPASEAESVEVMPMDRVSRPQAFKRN